MSYLRRRVITAALTANALRPPFANLRGGLTSFALGWPTSELAPQLLALTVADTALHLARGKEQRSRLGLLLAAGTAAGLVQIVRESRRVRVLAEQSLVDSLGVEYSDRPGPRPTEVDLRTPWRRLLNPFSFKDPLVKVDRNIPYSDAGRRGLLDIYRPLAGEPVGAPVLIEVHGGGWTMGSKDQQGVPLMQRMAGRGWVGVSINYRLAPRDPFPAQIIDVKRAIAWVKDHIEEYGGDPSYVVITGGSAGGHLAALAALTPNDPEYQPGFEGADTRVQAAVPFYGVYDFAGATGLKNALLMRDRFLAPRVVQATWHDRPEIFEHASPILRITSDAPDFFVLHGARDSLVDVEQARLFVAALRETSKASVAYAEFPGTQHAFDVFPSIRSEHVVRAVERYLEWHHARR
ncbi:MAG: alpha/beta hydrolase [Nocardioides sp.]|nr:alpha/beta hydrolase [Nocardioides sp.]